MGVLLGIAVFCSVERVIVTGKNLVDQYVNFSLNTHTYPPEIKFRTLDAW